MPDTFRVLPVATSTRLKLTNLGGWCRPLVAGLMRNPASRNIGGARSEIGGLASRSATSTWSDFGLTTTSGVGGALKRSWIGWGACWYRGATAAVCGAPCSCATAVAEASVAPIVIKQRMRGRKMFITLASVGGHSLPARLKAVHCSANLNAVPAFPEGLSRQKSSL